MFCQHCNGASDGFGWYRHTSHEGVRHRDCAVNGSELADVASLDARVALQAACNTAIQRYSAPLYDASGLLPCVLRSHVDRELSLINKVSLLETDNARLRAENAAAGRILFERGGIGDDGSPLAERLKAFLEDANEEGMAPLLAAALALKKVCDGDSSPSEIEAATGHVVDAIPRARMVCRCGALATELTIDGLDGKPVCGAYPKCKDGYPLGAREREELGQIVRDEWIAWAREQQNPKPSWLMPWESLSEPSKEVDRRIGVRIATRERTLWAYKHSSLRREIKDANMVLARAELVGGSSSFVGRIEGLVKELIQLRKDICHEKATHENTRVRAMFAEEECDAAKTNLGEANSENERIRTMLSREQRDTDIAVGELDIVRRTLTKAIAETTDTPEIHADKLAGQAAQWIRRAAVLLAPADVETTESLTKRLFEAWAKGVGMSASLMAKGPRSQTSEEAWALVEAEVRPHVLREAQLAREVGRLTADLKIEYAARGDDIRRLSKQVEDANADKRCLRSEGDELAALNRSANEALVSVRAERDFMFRSLSEALTNSGRVPHANVGDLVRQVVALVKPELDKTRAGELALDLLDRLPVSHVPAHEPNTCLLMISDFALRVSRGDFGAGAHPEAPAPKDAAPCRYCPEPCKGTLSVCEWHAKEDADDGGITSVEFRRIGEAAVDKAIVGERLKDLEAFRANTAERLEALEGDVQDLCVRAIETNERLARLEAAKPARPWVGRWVKHDGGLSVYDEHGQEVAQVYGHGDRHGWYARVAFGKPKSGDGLPTLEAAQAAALAVIRTWADVEGDEQPVGEPCAPKPFPLPGTRWRFNGNEQAPALAAAGLAKARASVGTSSGDAANCASPDPPIIGVSVNESGKGDNGNDADKDIGPAPVVEESTGLDVAMAGDAEGVAALAGCDAPTDTPPAPDGIMSLSYLNGCEPSVNDEQQAPKNTGSPPVWPMVISELDDELATYHYDASERLVTLVKRDMAERHELGKKRYGTPLTADNGRDHLLDAYQEALDLVVYLRANRAAEPRWFGDYQATYTAAIGIVLSLRARIARREGVQP